MPVSHVSLPVGQKNFQKMRDFYVQILAPLGYEIFMEKPGQTVGFGPKRGAPDFWLHCGGDEFQPFDGDVEKRGGKTHIAFDVGTVAKVHEWYEAAL
jgi:catechol 2,3-dioxygenase-like lactoylglutathione lyase family enzyme